MACTPEKSGRTLPLSSIFWAIRNRTIACARVRRTFSMTNPPCFCLVALFSTGAGRVGVSPTSRAKRGHVAGRRDAAPPILEGPAGRGIGLDIPPAVPAQAKVRLLGMAGETFEHREARAIFADAGRCLVADHPLIGAGL